MKRPGSSTFRLIRDEALNPYSGNLECPHWLHGTRLPTRFPVFLPGAPVVSLSLGGAPTALSEAA